MPVITHGDGGTAYGVGGDIAKILLAKRGLDLEEDRLKEAVRRATEHFNLEKEREARDKEYHEFRMEGAREQRGANKAFGEMLGQSLPGYLPQGQAQPSGADPRAAKMAARNSAIRSVASVDPEMGARLAASLEREQKQQGVSQAVSEIGKSMGARGSKGAYFARGLDGNPLANDENDQRFAVRAQNRQQRLAAIAQMEDPDQAIEEARKIAAEDEADADEIAAISKTNVAAGRKAKNARTRLEAMQASGVPQDRIDKAEGLVIDLESGVYDKDLSKFAKDFDNAERGLVTIPWGNETIDLPPEAAAKIMNAQAALQRAATDAAKPSQIDLIRERASEQRKTNEAKSGLELPKPKNGVLDRGRATSAARTELGNEAPADQVRRRADEILEEDRTKNGTPETLKADILGKRISKQEAEARARALGISPQQLKALLEKK